MICACVIREILGVSVEGVISLKFADGLFLLGVGQSDCLRVFSYIPLHAVSICQNDLYVL